MKVDRRTWRGTVGTACLQRFRCSCSNPGKTRNAWTAKLPQCSVKESRSGVSLRGGCVCMGEEE